MQTQTFCMWTARLEGDHGTKLVNEAGDLFSSMAKFHEGGREQL